MASLIEDIKNWYKNESYPPDGPEVDAELVSAEDGNQRRWGLEFTNVYKRDDEYVAVSDVRPATEYQNWGDYGDPEIYKVAPVTETITVTNYVKVVTV